VVDFDAGVWSPVTQPGRSARTLARVAAGRRAFGSRFVMPYYGSGSGATGRSLTRPLGTVTTRARWALVDDQRMRMVSAAEGRAVMGFPERYQLPGSQALAWHLLGNAVVPPVAADLLKAIARAA
jgi:DNA (cytosine-5)-methyltransferase 1